MTQWIDMKCIHEFRAISCNMAQIQGILLYCLKCGKAYGYDEDWDIVSLNKGD